MPESVDSHTGPPRVLIFEPQPAQEEDYLELFTNGGYQARAAQPRDDVAAICRAFAPDVVVFDMAFWEADTALAFGILLEALTFKRPIVVSICTIPFHVGRAKRFGADGMFRKGGARIWSGPEIMPAEELPRLVVLCNELLARREAGELKPRVVRTPL